MEIYFDVTTTGLPHGNHMNKNQHANQIMAFNALGLYRNELYVILCCDAVYKQETPGTVISPTIPYEEVMPKLSPQIRVQGRNN